MNNIASGLIATGVVLNLAIVSLERRWGNNPRSARILAEIRLAFIGAIIFCCGLLAGMGDANSAARAAWAHSAGGGTQAMSYSAWAAVLCHASGWQFLLSGRAWPGLMLGIMGILAMTWGRPWFVGKMGKGG